jgi:hypothetical protein
MEVELERLRRENSKLREEMGRLGEQDARIAMAAQSHEAKVPDAPMDSPDDADPENPATDWDRWRARRESRKRSSAKGLAYGRWLRQEHQQEKTD